MKQPPSVNRNLATGILMFAAFMDLIDVTIVNVALPSIRNDLHASPSHLEWILSGYTLAFAVLLITGGRLGDIVGRQRIFLLGVAGFTLASAAACFAGNGDVLVAARIVQGGFAAMMVPQLISSVQVMYEPRERAAVFGIIGAVSGTAAVIGPLLGGWLVTSDAFGIGWRSIFLINIPVGIALFTMAVRSLPNTKSERAPRLDLPGVALATTGLFLLVYPLIEGREQGWPAWIWAMFGASTLVLATFIAYESRADRQTRGALLPTHLFANRGFASGLVTQASFQGSMAGFVLCLIIYVQSGLGFSAIHAGLVLLPFSLGAFVGVGISAPFGLRLGKVVPFAGAMCQAGGVWWLARIVGDKGDGLSGWSVTLPMLLAGIGLGLLVVPLIDIALTTVSPDDAGAASGTFSTFQQLGAALGIAIIGAVFFNSVGDDFTSAGLRTALQDASTWVVGGYLICAASTLLLPDRKAVQEHARVQEELLSAQPATSPAAT